MVHKATLEVKKELRQSGVVIPDSELVEFEQLPPRDIYIAGKIGIRVAVYLSNMLRAAK